MPPIVIALGSNVGDRVAHLVEATQALAETFAIQKVSRIYESDAMYLTEQPPYLNAAVLVHATDGPRTTLTKLKQLELSLGRQARVRNGPREIDLDMIAYGNLSYIYQEAGEIKLQVPHPRTFERAFVLRPVADISPDFFLPGVGNVANLLDNLGDAAESAQVRPDAVLPLHRI